MLALQFLIICWAFFCWFIIFLVVYILWLTLKWFFFLKINLILSVLNVFLINSYFLFCIWFFWSNHGWWKVIYVDSFYNGRWDANYCNSSIVQRILVIIVVAPPLVQLSIVNPCHKKIKSMNDEINVGGR